MENSPPRSGEERRRHYRVTESTQLAVDVEVQWPDGRRAPVVLVDASSAGVGVRCDSHSREQLSVGGRVTVHMRSERLAEDLAIGGSIVNLRFGGARPLEVGIGFVDWSSANRDLDPHFLRLFNERRSFRVPPTDAEQASLRVILRSSGPSPRSTSAVLADLSVDGAGIWVKHGDVGIALGDNAALPQHAGFGHQSWLQFGRAERVRPGEPVDLGLRLPHSRDEHRLRCRLVHLEAAPGQKHQRAGLELPGERSMPRAVQQAIQAWVAQRQREMRQAEAAERERLAALGQPGASTVHALGRRG
jgi:hypothetical protein